VVLQGESLEALLEQQFTLIMYSYPIDPQSLSLVQEYGQKHKVPLISLHSAGFYSYFRTNLPGTFPIVDTHPDSTATTDLRLLTPWPELSDFAAELTKDISKLNLHKHGHIPYVALLLYYLAQWKEMHGSLPSTYKDKIAFRNLVGDEARTDNSEGGEENYDEAVAAVLKTISTPTLATSVKEVFDYQPNEVGHEP
jgi:NEDD8-activating enzyme E1 regulatory subunit